VSRNLVVVVLDTLRADSALESGWSRVIPSSQVDDVMIASSPMTPPSHLSLLDGQEPWEYFEPSARGRSERPAESIAEVWNARGGESVAFSANPVVATPSLLHGFNEINPGMPRALPIVVLEGMGISDVAMAILSRVLTPPVRLASVHETSRAELARLSRMACAIVPILTRKSFSSGRFIASLKRYLNARDTHRDLFLFINLLEAHEPYVPERVAEVRHDEDILPSFDLGFHSRRLSDQMISPAGFRAGYADAVGRAMSALAETLGVLRAARILDDALLVVTSDHGQSLGENGFFGHGRHLYDELVRVPLAISSTPSERAGVTMGAKTPDSVDHRHVFDLVLEYAREETHGAPIEALAKSIDRRGPALSYWEGAPMGSDRLLARGDPYRLLRLTSTGGSVTLRSDATGIHRIASKGDPVACDGLSRRMAEQGWADAGVAGSRQPGFRADSVSRRLASWGYH
jgi:hypothetical protein